MDTDILLDNHGNTVEGDDEKIFDNIRARLQFVVDEDYVALSQFQRWRAQQSKRVK